MMPEMQHGEAAHLRKENFKLNIQVAELEAKIKRVESAIDYMKSVYSKEGWCEENDGYRDAVELLEAALEDKG